MTPEARKRAPFELLAFTAAPVAGALVVIEVEGRFADRSGRFARQPALVVEAADDRPRLELAPVRAELRDAYWRGVYAIPAEAFLEARFALGVRETLLELPAPDEAATARDEAAARIDAAEQRASDAEARAQAAEEAARAADAGTDVLRAELAEERERSRAAIAVLEADLEAARRRADALRNAAATDAQQGTHAIQPEPATPPSSTHRPAQRGPGPWIAVGALVLFALVLLGLLLGFLA